MQWCFTASLERIHARMKTTNQCVAYTQFEKKPISTSTKKESDQNLFVEILVMNECTDSQ
jgi:hypothetical protein